MDKLKVLHITNNYPTREYPIFGIFVKEQIDSLSDIGVENEIFFINGRENGKLEYLRSIIGLKKFLKGKQFDIIHCHHAFSAICFILTGQSKKFKSVVSYQNDPANEHGKKLFRFVCKFTNAIIFKNNSPIIDNTSIYNQPNGVDTGFFYPINKNECFSKLNLNAQKQYILFVSSNFLREQKRYDRFHQVLAILQGKYKMNNIEELRLVNTERNLVPYYFNAVDLHLLTSDFEGSPNSVKEAMACNIPVVSTNVGNVAELLTGVTGSYIAETMDPEELAELAYKALTNLTPVNSREALIKKELDGKSVAKKIVNIYNQVIQ